MAVFNRAVTSLVAAVKHLLRQPAYATTVVATLALGIGAVTAVFALVHAVVLSALPFPQAEQLVVIRNQNAGGAWNTSVVDFRGIEASGTAFEAVAAMRAASALVGSAEQAEWLNARWVSAGFFDVIGLAPARGRGFLDGEDRVAADRVVVLGHAFAERRFGARDPLGQSMMIDGLAHTVVGVMPAGTESLPVIRADLWPVLQNAEPERRGPFFLATLARIRPGITLDAAAADLDAVSRRLFPLWQQGFNDETARLVPFALRDVVVGGSARFLWIALCCVAVVLLIVLVNNANLLLMRIAQRTHDLQIRSALGASRWQLARAMIGENLLLAALGGAGGALLAGGLLVAYRSLGPAIPRLAEVGLNPAVLGLAAALALFSAAVLAVVPMLRSGLGQVVTDMARTASVGKDPQRVRDALVVLEFALALPLVVAAGLLVDSLLRLQRVDPGFDAQQVLTAHLRLAENNYPDAVSRLRFWGDAMPALQNLPGVLAVGLAGVLPPQCGCYNNYDLLDRPALQGNEPQAPWVPVNLGFFDALGVKLVEGRLFDSRDTPESPAVVVVTHAWAQRHFPGESALDRRLYEGGDRSRTVAIVGVVEDVRFDGLESPGVAVFAPVEQGWSADQLYLILRTAGEPMAVAASVRATLQRMDPALVPSDVESMTSLLASTLGGQRHWAAVIAGFALAAVVLAAIGVFGVLAYHVAQRQREIGIRQAIGADPHSIVLLVMRRGLHCAGVGIAIGSVLALFLVRGLDSLLFQVQRTDLWPWLAAWALLIGVGAAAAWLPARRAAHVSPLVALRQE